MASTSTDAHWVDRALLERGRQAADRWANRAAAREARREAAAAGRYLEADSPERLALRVNRLLSNVRRSARDRRPPADARLRELMEGQPVTAAQLDNELVKEVVLGARDFLSVEFFERGLAACRSVGRVAVRGGRGNRPLGTGFLVAPGLLLTNEHVLPDNGKAAGCLVEMDYEQNLFGPPKQVQIFDLAPDRFFLCDPNLDFAIVAVAPRSGAGIAIESYGWLPLNGAQGKIAVLPMDFLNIVQHPLGREKEIVIRENRLLDLRTGNEPADDGLGPFLHYEADTEKGSSGSPVLNDQWEVVALHHAGVPDRDAQARFLDKNGKVWDEATQAVEAIRWVANEGVRISSLVSRIERAKVPPHEREILDRFLSAQSPPVFAVQSVAEENVGREGPKEPDGISGHARPSGTRKDVAAAGRGMAQTTVSESVNRASDTVTSVDLEVPLRISLSFGRHAALSSAHAMLPARELARSAGEAILVERLRPEDYVDREGYRPEFLGTLVPLPGIKKQSRFGGALPVPRLARPQENPHELKYHNFSVIMNKARRLAYLSAVNIDFAAPVNLSRKQGSSTWRFDGRIDENYQVDDRYYSDNDYDRGHLTRRDDAAWGATKNEARLANDDTFHWTNAAPQHRDFNQSDEFTHKNLRLWGDLENFISQQGSAQHVRLCVFNGPIFGVNDKPLRDIRVPRAFFKVVVFKDGSDADPGAVGFVLEQSDLLRRMPEEAIEAGEFELRQRSIETIEAMVDLDFGAIKSWDRARRARQPEGHESLEDAPLRRLADILI